MAVEARCVPAPRCAMLVADEDTVVIEPDDATFGDCYSKDVACQIAQHGLSAVDPRLCNGSPRASSRPPWAGRDRADVWPEQLSSWPTGGRVNQLISGSSTATPTTLYAVW